MIKTDHSSRPRYWRLTLALGFLCVAGCRSPNHAVIDHLGCEAAEDFEEAESTICWSVGHRVASKQIPVSLRNDPPVTLDDSGAVDLQSAINAALSNSPIIRVVSASTQSPSRLLSNPASVTTKFDPAIQNTGVLFGNRGVSAALSDFDPTIRMNSTWSRDENIQNSLFSSGGVNPGDTLTTESSSFGASIEKRLPAGGRIRLTQSVDYLGDNAPSRLFSSAYTTAARAEFRQPLLAGAGHLYNGIAGPLDENLRSITGVQQGVLIARLNQQMSQLEFQASVRQMVVDVETAFLRVDEQRQILAILDEAVADAEDAVKKAEVLERVGESGGARAQVADAKSDLIDIRTRRSEAHAALLEQEATLRRLMGLPADSQEAIVPQVSPMLVEFAPDWHLAADSALAARPELQRQRKEIQSLSYQLAAAQNVNASRLDFVSAYSLNGFGDDLLGPRNSRPGSQGLGTALGSQYSGDETGWTLGFQFERALGTRLGRTQVANIELRLARARAILKAQEEDILHELASANREIERTWIALGLAKERVEQQTLRHRSLVSLNKAQPDGVDDAQIRRAAAAASQARVSEVTASAACRLAIANWNRISCQTMAAHQITESTPGRNPLIPPAAEM